MMNNRLVFDLGMHKAEDTGFYLFKGYKVVAVDADPIQIEAAKQKFNENIEKGDLILVNKGLSEKDDETLDFHISEYSEWNSFKKEISDRKSNLKEIIKVKSVTISSLIEKYGMPFFCKIDIEGFDIVCLDNLLKNNLKPQFISVESECVGEYETLSNEGALETLEGLRKIGYTKFKLVDQASLQSLAPKSSFYGIKSEEGFLFKITRKILHKFSCKVTKYTRREIECMRNNYSFPMGASGPFGDEINSNWYNYEEAREMLVFHRNEFFNKTNGEKFSFWCDWHATT